MANAILRGKSDAGNPHIRSEEGDVASPKPRRGSLLSKKRLLVMVSMVAAMTASAEYQYIIDPGVRPAKPTPVPSSEAIAVADIVGATSGGTAPGGASWLYARWSEFTDYVRVRRDKFVGFIISFR